MTRKGDESFVQKEFYSFVEEIKEVQLRSHRGKFIYNRPYNSGGLNMVSHFSRCGRAPSSLPMKKLNYHIDTDVIPGFFFLLKNHIFIVCIEDTIFIFHV